MWKNEIFLLDQVPIYEQIFQEFDEYCRVNLFFNYRTPNEVILFGW